MVRFQMMECLIRIADGKYVSKEKHPQVYDNYYDACKTLLEKHCL